MSNSFEFRVAAELAIARNVLGSHRLRLNKVRKLSPLGVQISAVILAVLYLSFCFEGYFA